MFSGRCHSFCWELTARGQTCFLADVTALVSPIRAARRRRNSCASDAWRLRYPVPATTGDPTGRSEDFQKPAVTSRPLIFQLLARRRCVESKIETLARHDDELWIDHQHRPRGLLSGLLRLWWHRQEGRRALAELPIGGMRACLAAGRALVTRHTANGSPYSVSQASRHLGGVGAGACAPAAALPAPVRAAPSNSPVGQSERPAPEAISALAALSAPACMMKSISISTRSNERDGDAGPVWRSLAAVPLPPPNGRYHTVRRSRDWTADPATLTGCRPRAWGRIEPSNGTRTFAVHDRCPSAAQLSSLPQRQGHIARLGPGWSTTDAEAPLCFTATCPWNQLSLFTLSSSSLFHQHHTFLFPSRHPHTPSQPCALP